ncbi:hypothetical protein Ciccas_002792 [Cichlidogyrus casuarinus]|uniref:Uncharacterized protein n=1 Tax=Cichlidogyrus casuarinus TaxID=1844966 RepID=A0ABD2QG91_9PLAT
MLSYCHLALQQGLVISEERMTQFNNMLGQYDYLCERIITLMLRHGAGVPHDVHVEVSRVALKKFPTMFPFNVTRTETKLKIVVEVLRSVYSGEVGDLRMMPLPSILTILQPSNSYLARLPQIIIPVLQALARVAGQECRFIAQPPHGDMDLPLVEEQLVKNVLLFIFLVYMNCNNREKYPVVNNSWLFKKQDSTALSEDRVFFFDCTVFDAAQEQLIFLSEQHPNVVIPMLLQVILAIFQPEHSSLDSQFLKDLKSSSCGFTAAHLVELCHLIQWTRLSSVTVSAKDLEVLVAFLASHQEPVPSLEFLLSQLTRSLSKKSSNPDKIESIYPIETCGCEKHSNSLVHSVAKAILGRLKICKLLKDQELRHFQDNYMSILTRLVQIHLDQPKVLSEMHFLPFLDSAYSLAEYIQNAGQSVGDLALTLIGRQRHLAITLPPDSRQKTKAQSPFVDASRDPDELFNFAADQIHFLDWATPDHSESQEIMIRHLKLVLDENSFNNLENLVHNSKNVALLALLVQMELDPMLQRGSTLNQFLQTQEGELWLRLISRLLSMKQQHLTFDFVFRVLSFAALDTSSKPLSWCGPRESSGAIFSNLLLTIFSASELKTQFLYRFVQALFQWEIERSLQVLYHFIYATAACHQLTKFTSTSNCVQFLDKLCEVEFVLLQKSAQVVPACESLKKIAYSELLNLQAYLCTENLTTSAMYQSSLGGFRSRSSMISNLLTFHGNARSVLQTTFDDLNVRLGNELNCKRTKRSHSAFGLMRGSHVEESSGRNGSHALFKPFWLINRLLSICPQSDLTQQMKLFSIFQRESVRMLTSANRIAMSKSSLTTSSITSTGSISPSESILVDVMVTFLFFFYSMMRQSKYPG